MKALYLLRHGKSDWPQGQTADLDRPLAARGRRAAPLVGGYLRENGLLPDLVLCSPALRTRQTFELVRSSLGDPPVRFLQELYLASPPLLLKRVQAFDEDVGSAMLIGHNPGIAALAVMLAHDGTGDALTRVQRKYPTAALAVLRFPVGSWEEVGEGSGHLERFVTPRDLE